MQKLRSLCFLIIGIFLFTGCTNPFKKDDSDGSGYLFTYTLIGNPQNLDPQSATDKSSKIILRNMMQGLMEEDENGQIITAAAKSYSISEDFLTYTFVLRPDLYWYYDENHNSLIDDDETWQVTADDFVFAFQRIFNPDTKSPHIEKYKCLKNAQSIINGETDYKEIGVYAENPERITFQLDYANIEFLNLLASTPAMPCNQKFFEKTKGRYGLDEESVISNGSFYMRRWFYDPYGNDNLIYMQCNDANSVSQRVFPSDLTFLIRNTDKQAEDLFSKEDSDILTTAVGADEYQNKNKYEVSTHYTSTLGLIFNPESETFSNPEVREALLRSAKMSAIDSADGLDLKAANGLIPPEIYSGKELYRSYIKEPESEEYDKDSYTEILKNGMESLNIESLPSENILICEKDVNSVVFYPMVQNWQAELQFYAGIETVSEEEFTYRLKSGEYSIAIYSLSGNENSPASVLSKFKIGENPFSYSNADIDSKIKILDTAVNEKNLAEMCSEIEQEIIQEKWFVPLFYKANYFVHRDENTEIKYNPYSGEINFRTAKHFE